MGYRVVVIGEHELPADQGWALIEIDQRCTVFAVKPSAFSVEVMAEAWAAYRKLVRTAQRLASPATGTAVLQVL